MNRRRRKNRAAGRRASAVENVAPVATSSGPLHASAESIRFLRQNKHNPLPYLKPEMLSGALDAFEHGRIREAVFLWEKMAERDDVLLSVKPKREKDVSQLDMQVVVEEDAGPDGARHQAVLKKFWKSVRATNAYDRNERGKFRRLIKQMMSATSFRYAAHHIIWDPRPNGELRATFEFVPLWLFENTTGKLRYLETPGATHGKDLADGEWMVTTGDGLMIACSIGYLAKRSAFNDWLVFSEKFSVPGVLGRTSAAAGTPEATAMEEATQAFGHDWCAVITGDDGTHAKPIEIIQAEGNPAGMPMPAVIERVDRRMAALYRGADLSSMSSGPSGEGTGASLQEKETDILRRDDAETIAETLEEVSRLVIEWYFGAGVEPLARVELVVPVSEDATSVVTAAGTLADRGAKVSSSALMERLNLPEAADEADALRPAGGQTDVKVPEARPQDSRPEVFNAVPGETGEQWETMLRELRTALAKDMRPLGDALWSAYQAGDYAALQAGLRKVSEAMPELAGDAENLTGVLGASMAAAFLADEAEEMENAGNSDGARKGWETRRANGWTSKRAGAAIAQGTDSMREALARKADVMNAMDVPGLGMVDFRWGTNKGGILHVVEKHGEDEAMQIPGMLFSGELVVGKSRAWVDAADSYVLLANDFQGQPSNHWVITGYIKKEGSDAP